MATLEPSPWSIIHTNLVLQNAGTGTAYDIEVEFSPALKLNRRGEIIEMTARSLSVLKPGSSFSVFLDGFEKLNEQVVDVRIAWSRAPSTGERESYSYRLDLIGDYDNWGQLGGPPPLIQIAQDMKKLREEVAKFPQTIGLIPFRHPPASRSFAAQTGGPSGARERDLAGSAAVRNSLPEQIAFGVAGSPGLAALAGG